MLVTLLLLGVIGVTQSVTPEVISQPFHATTTYTTFSTTILTSYSYRTSVSFRAYTTLTTVTQKEREGPYLKITFSWHASDARDPNFGTYLGYQNLWIYVWVTNLMDIPAEHGEFYFKVTRAFLYTPFWIETKTAKVKFVYQKPIEPGEKVMMDKGFKADDLFGPAATQVTGSEVSLEAATFSRQMVVREPVATYTYSEERISTIVQGYTTSSVIFSIGPAEMALVAIAITTVVAAFAAVALLKKVTSARTRRRPSGPPKPIALVEPSKPVPTPASNTKHCPECGLLMPLEAKHCPKCGIKQYYYGE